MKTIKEHPLSGLAGMSDSSDTKQKESKQLDAGYALDNPASKGRIVSGDEQSRIAGDKL